jgi:hypothetical protein
MSTLPPMAELSEPMAGWTGRPQIQVGVAPPGSNLDGAGAVVRGPMVTSDQELNPTEQDGAAA